METILKTKIGFLKIISKESYIKKIEYLKDKALKESKIDDSFLKNVKQQLNEYFSGLRTSFDIPILLEGFTEFQKSVWQEMLQIPFGQTLTYGEVAKRLGKAGAQRAVGGACNKNPIPIIIPCHRIVASSGPGGFAWGIDIKSFLFRIEGISH